MAGLVDGVVSTKDIQICEAVAGKLMHDESLKHFCKILDEDDATALERLIESDKSNVNLKKYNSSMTNMGAMFTLMRSGQGKYQNVCIHNISIFLPTRESYRP